MQHFCKKKFSTFIVNNFLKKTLKNVWKCQKLIYITKQYMRVCVCVFIPLSLKPKTTQRKQSNYK